VRVHAYNINAPLLDETRTETEASVKTIQKTLLVHADFLLDRSRGGDRLIFKRWRRALAEFLPRIMGISKRCSRARVRLHYGEEQGRFSVWLRIPVERYPGRKRLQRIKEKLREKLESALLAIGGDVVKFGIRRCQRKPVLLDLAQPELTPLRLAQSDETAAGSLNGVPV
jgi:hypothetical protein